MRRDYFVYRLTYLFSFIWIYWQWQWPRWSRLYFTNLWKSFTNIYVWPDVFPEALKEFAVALVNNLRLRLPDTGIYNAMIFLKSKSNKVKWNSNIWWTWNQNIRWFLWKFQVSEWTSFSAKVYNRTRLIQEWREAKLLLKNYREFNFIDRFRRVFTGSQFLTLYR